MTLLKGVISTWITFSFESSHFTFDKENQKPCGRSEVSVSSSSCSSSKRHHEGVDGQNDLRLWRKEASARLRPDAITGDLCCPVIPWRGAAETPQSKVLWFHFEQRAGSHRPVASFISLACLPAWTRQSLRWRYANGKQLVPPCRAVGPSAAATPFAHLRHVVPKSDLRLLASLQGAVSNPEPPTGAGAMESQGWTLKRRGGAGAKPQAIFSHSHVHDECNGHLLTQIVDFTC